MSEFSSLFQTEDIRSNSKQTICSDGKGVIMTKEGKPKALVNGELLRQLRNIYGYTSAEMCEKLGISKSHLSNIEREKATAGMPVVKKYAEVFGVKCSQLVALSENYPGTEEFARMAVKILVSEILASKGNAEF